MKVDGCRYGARHQSKEEMPDLIYLASPYSHPDAAAREARFDAVCAATAAMMRDGLMIYSPIGATHAMACKHELPLEWQFWAAYDELIISRCDRLWVLTIDGWDKSVGVTAEVKIAEKFGKPLDFIEWDGERYEVLQSFATPLTT